MGRGLKRIVCKVIAKVTYLGIYGNFFPIKYQFINDDTNLGCVCGGGGAAKLSHNGGGGQWYSESCFFFVILKFSPMIDSSVDVF